MDGRVIDLLPMGAERSRRAANRCTRDDARVVGNDLQAPSAGKTCPGQNAQAYLNRLETLCQVPIAIVSTGPERDETILKQHPFKYFLCRRRWAPVVPQGDFLRGAVNGNQGPFFICQGEADEARAAGGPAKLAHRCGFLRGVGERRRLSGRRIVSRRQLAEFRFEYMGRIADLEADR